MGGSVKKKRFENENVQNNLKQCLMYALLFSVFCFIFQYYIVFLIKLYENALLKRVYC